MDRYSPLFRKIILPIYWAFLTYMLLRPGIENMEYAFMMPGIDKVLHFCIFGALGFCLRVSFPRLTFSTFIQLTFAYALLTEILQDVMGFGRSLEILDIFADMIGILLGYFFYTFLKKRFS